jgi:hypothetical protein
LCFVLKADGLKNEISDLTKTVKDVYLNEIINATKFRQATWELAKIKLKVSLLVVFFFFFFIFVF